MSTFARGACILFGHAFSTQVEAVRSSLGSAEEHELYEQMGERRRRVPLVNELALGDISPEA